MDKITIFKSLSNDARLNILEWLKDPKTHFDGLEKYDYEELGVCVNTITRKLKMTQSTVSQYLSQLQRAGLIKSKRLGKWTYYKRDEEAIQKLGQHILSDL